jgi:hypothetical protein
MTEKKKIRLENPRQIRRFLGKLMNDVYTGTVETETARTIATLANSFLKCYEISETELRLNVVETTINNRDIRFIVLPDYTFDDDDIG